MLLYYWIIDLKNNTKLLCVCVCVCVFCFSIALCNWIFTKKIKKKSILYSVILYYLKSLRFFPWLFFHKCNFYRYIDRPLFSEQFDAIMILRLMRLLYKVEDKRFRSIVHFLDFYKISILKLSNLLSALFIRSSIISSLSKIIILLILKALALIVIYYVYSMIISSVVITNFISLSSRHLSINLMYDTRQYIKDTINTIVISDVYHVISVHGFRKI